MDEMMVKQLRTMATQYDMPSVESIANRMQQLIEICEKYEKIPMCMRK